VDPNNTIPTSDAARGPVEDASSIITNDVPDSGAGHENQAIRNDGLPTGTVAPPTQPVEESPEPVQETAPINKEDQKRFEYWQSQHDKVLSENQAMRQELQQAAQYIQQTQAQAQQTQLSNGQPTGVQNQEPSLQKPVRPQKPHTYNEVDAFNDPESESFKYRQSLDEYRDSVIDYYDRRDQVMEQEVMRQQQQFQQQRNDVEARQYMMNNVGWDEQKTAGFMEWARNPQNVTFEHLAKIYEQQIAPTPDQIARQQKVEEMQNMQQRIEVPRTTAVTTGTTPPPQSDEQMFSADLLAKGKAMAKGIR
jgi:hypothetical protein